MRGLFTLFIVSIFAIGVSAQAPEKMSYQAIVRNSSNQLVVSQQVGIRVSILQAAANGTGVYTETQTPLTNQNGLISIEIGSGTGFSAIDWSNGPFFIKTEIDPSGGTNYTITGTTQLLSVPYALYAVSSDYSKLKNKPNLSAYLTTETDPVFNASAAKGIKASDIDKWNIEGDDYAGVANAISALQQLFNEQAFENTSGKFIDTRDNQVYKFVTIGSQVWMAQNLNYYTSSGSLYYNHDSVSYAATYGRLYQWQTAKNVCPVGWHLPTEAEFIQMITSIGGVLAYGGYPDTGGKLKETGTTHWQSPNTGATNATGFNGVPAGWHQDGSGFHNVNKEARFWSATERTQIDNTAAPFTLEYNTNYVRDYGFLPIIKPTHCLCAV
jgi:uncharacterized protein (TIGR02145 family)